MKAVALLRVSGQSHVDSAGRDGLEDLLIAQGPRWPCRKHGDCWISQLSGKNVNHGTIHA
jgi:hypothetical protein